MNATTIERRHNIRLRASVRVFRERNPAGSNHLPRPEEIAV